MALGLGMLGLGAFLWARKSGQFDDVEGGTHPILFENDVRERQGGASLSGTPSASVIEWAGSR